jgi:hypothetical protein
MDLITGRILESAKSKAPQTISNHAQIRNKQDVRLSM